MRRASGSDRATHRCSDQAPFSSARPPYLKCRRRFIADHPTLPQALAISPLRLPSCLGAPTSQQPTWYFFVGPLYRSAAALNSPHGFVTPLCPLIPLPTRPASNHSGFKTHSSFVPIEGFLHCAVSKPPRPRIDPELRRSLAVAAVLPIRS